MSNQLTERDRKILQHIGRNWFTFKEVLSQLFFDGADPQNVLNRLVQAGLIQNRKGFTGNRSAYQLLPKGTKVAGVSRRRAEPLGSAAIPFSLAVFGFCFLKGHSRLRLERSELDALFGTAPPGKCHCLERGTKAMRVYRVYAPGSSVDSRETVENTRAQVGKALDQPEIARWMKHRLYAFAVLVDNRERAQEISCMMDQGTFDRGQPLQKVAPIQVELVPSLDTLEEALRVLA